MPRKKDNRLTQVFFAMAILKIKLDAKLKKELDRFCKTRGLKPETVAAEAVTSWFEDAQDIQLLEKRKSGPWVDWNIVKNE